MIGMNTGQAMVSVGVAMVLQDQFTNQANHISRAYKQMMDDIYRSSMAPSGLTEMVWSRGAAAGALTAMGGLIDSYQYFADVQNDVYWATKMANGSIEDQQAILEKVKEVNLITPLTNKDLSSAARFMAMAGNSTKAFNQMLEPVAELSGIFGMQAGGKGGVADLFTNISMMFGRNLEDQQEAFNVANELYAVTTSTNTNLSDLAQAITYSGSEMRRAGYGLKETAASIGVLGNYGIQGSAAGTALANMMRYIQLSAAGQKAKGADMLKAVGIDAKSLMDSEGHLIPLMEIYQRMYEVTKDLDTFSKNQFFYNVFGVRGTREIAAMVQMIEDAAGEATKYEQVVEKMGDAAANNKLGQDYDKWVQDEAGQLAMFNAELDNLRTTIGQQIAPLYTPILTSLNSVLSMVGWLASSGLGGVIVRSIAIGTALQLFIRGLVAVRGLFATINGLGVTFGTSIGGGSHSVARMNYAFSITEMHLRTLITMMAEYIAMQRASAGLAVGSGAYSIIGRTGKVHNYTAAQYMAVTQRRATMNAAMTGGLTAAALTNAGKTAGQTAAGIAGRTIGSRILGFLGGPWGIALTMAGPMIYQGIKEMIGKQEEEINTIKEQIDKDGLDLRQQQILRETLEEASRQGIITGMSQSKIEVNVPDTGSSVAYIPIPMDANNEFSIWG